MSAMKAGLYVVVVVLISKKLKYFGAPEKLMGPSHCANWTGQHC